MYVCLFKQSVRFIDPEVVPQVYANIFFYLMKQKFKLLKEYCCVY